MDCTELYDLLTTQTITVNTPFLTNPMLSLKRHNNEHTLYQQRIHTAVIQYQHNDCFDRRWDINNAFKQILHFLLNIYLGSLPKADTSVFQL